MGRLETDFSKNNRVFIAPAITWSPSADTSLTILANYQWDELTPNTFLPIASPLYPDLAEILAQLHHIRSEFRPL